MRYRRGRSKFKAKKLASIMLFLFVAAMTVYILRNWEILFKSSALKRPIGEATSEQLIYQQIAASPLPLKRIPLIEERQIKLELEGDIEVILSTTKNLAIQLNSLQMLLSSFKIRGEAPKRIDLRYDKPVITYN